MTLTAVLNTLSAGIPGGLRLRYKSESWFMHLLAAVLIFNPRFLTTFSTTIGRTVYLPSREWAEQHPRSAEEVLAHEAVHAYDYANAPVSFALGYLFPQVLAGVPLLGMVVSLLTVRWGWIVLAFLAGVVGAACVAAVKRYVKPAAVLLGIALGGLLGFAIVSHAALGAILAVLLVLSLAPWPAPWRVKAELRGYAMTLATTYWSTGEISAAMMGYLHDQFVGPNYYWMSWRSRRADLTGVELLVTTDKILDAPGPYKLALPLFRRASP